MSSGGTTIAKALSRYYVPRHCAYNLVVCKINSLCFTLTTVPQLILPFGLHLFPKRKHG